MSDQEKEVAMPLTSWWLSTERMTVLVDVDDSDMVVRGPPIVRKFVGQPLTNLVRWLQKQPGFIGQEVYGQTQQN